MSVRDGTCIEDRFFDIRDGIAGWRSECGHGTKWRVGDTKAACSGCVQAECAHAKYSA